MAPTCYAPRSWATPACRPPDADPYPEPPILTVKLSIYALLAGAVSIASPAAAQDDQYMQQVAVQLVAVAEAMGDEGLEMAGEPEGGSLNDDETAEMQIRVNPGEYLIVGACDTDCSDLDMAVIMNGKVAGSDTATDDTPVVTLTVTRPTTLTIRVLMTACSSEPCRYGVAAFGR